MKLEWLVWVTVGDKSVYSDEEESYARYQQFIKEVVKCYQAFYPIPKPTELDSSLSKTATLFQEALDDDLLGNSDKLGEILKNSAELNKM